jgi:S-layer protein
VTATDDITAAVTIAGIESVNFNLDAISATGMGGGAGGTAGFDVNVEGISNGTVTAAVTKAASPITAAKFTNVGDGLTVASAHSITAAADANANITINATGAAAQTITAVTGTLDDLTIVGSGTGLLTVTNATAEENISITAAGGVTVTDLVAATTTDAIQSLTISAGGAITITDSNNHGSINASTTSGAITIGATDMDATESVTLSTSAGNVTVTNADDSDQTLTVTAVGDGDAAAAAADGDITVTSASSMETVVLNATGDINLDDVEAAGTITLTAGQASNIANTVSDANTLTIASNSTAATAVMFTATAGDGGTNGAADGFAELDTINFTGSNSVSIEFDASDLVTAAASTAGSTTAAAVVATDSMTGGTSRIEFFADGGGAAVNIRSLAVDEIALDVAANGGDSFLMNSGQGIIIAADQTADVAITLSATPGNSATVTIEDDASATAVNDMAGITTSNVKTLNLIANDSASTAAATTGALNVGAGNDIIVTGGGALNVNAAVTGANFNASAATGAITISATNATTIFKTGSGADSITSGGATNLNIDAGGGADTLVLAAADYSGSTISWSNIETIDISASGITVAGSHVTGGSYVFNANATTDTLGVTAQSATGETIDLSSTSAIGVVTITGAAGTDTLTGSSTTATTFVGAAAADTIVGGGAADTVTFLSETGAADTITGGGAGDAFNQAATAAATMVATKITDMTLGTSTTATDTFSLSLTAIKGLTTTTDVVDTSANSGANGNGTVVAVATDGGTIANADLVVLSQTYATDTAALAGMKTTGADTITYGAALTDNDSFFVAYSDGSNINIAVATAGGANLATTEGLDSVATVLQFTGVTDTSLIDSTDYSTIT